MKKALFLTGLLWSLATAAQTGYEIKVTFKPFKNQYIYLGHYFGKSYPIIDSARLDENSQAVFKGDKKLSGGIYLMGYPNKAGFLRYWSINNSIFQLSLIQPPLPRVPNMKIPRTTCCSPITSSR